MKKRGQALVEFVIILPLFLMLVLGVIDIGQILYQRNYLESEITDVISLYNGGKTKDEIEDTMELSKNNIDIMINQKDTTEFVLTKNVSIITPGLNLIFDNPYPVTVSRSINE